MWKGARGSRLPDVTLLHPPPSPPASPNSSLMALLADSGMVLSCRVLSFASRGRRRDNDPGRGFSSASYLLVGGYLAHLPMDASSPTSLGGFAASPEHSVCLCLAHLAS